MPPSLKIGINFWPDEVIKWFTSTIIGALLAARGTSTIKVFVVAFNTLALTPPKNTILFVFVELKLVPIIVTFEPAYPETGLKELIEGNCAFKEIRLKKQEAKHKNRIFIQRG